MSVLGGTDRRGIGRLVGHWGALFRLAWPVMLSRAGVILMAMADVVMVGRFDTHALAALSLGLSVFNPAFIAGIGALVGIVSVTARSSGSGDPDVPAIGLRGLWWAAFVGLVAVWPVLLAGPILAAIGHDADLVRAAASVALWLAPGALFQLVFAGASFYLEGTGRTKPGLVAMIAANLVNLGLNGLLIWGMLGAPQMGAEGAALASTLARFVMMAGLLVWMWRLPEFDGVRGAAFRLWGPGGWGPGAEMRRIGMAGGAAYFFETVAFSAVAQTAGLLGTAALAAYSILHNIETTVFMIALGLAVATAVRVGQAMGAGDRHEARSIAFAGLSAAMLLIGLIGGGLVFVAPQVTGFYSRDPALLALATPLFAIMALSLVFDAGQVVLGQTTRALGDAWGTTLRFFVAFWLVMVPLSVGLALHTPLAEAGLFIGTGLGCAAAFVLLGRRLLWLLDRQGS